MMWNAGMTSLVKYWVPNWFGNGQKEELAEIDYDENELRKVDVQITRLRQKIEENPKQPHYIKTIRGKGYQLICDEL